MRPVGLAVCSALLAACATSAGHRNDSSRSYHVVHGWPVLPTNQILDEVSAVAVDSHEHVFVLTRAGRKWPDNAPLDTVAIPGPTVFVFDGQSGKLLRQWPGNLFALPHSITIDDQDRVWIADVAWHQVFEFSHDGALLRALGQRAVPGADRYHFNQPSDVAVAKDGTVLVSDGYGNNRVVKFSADGTFIQEWGRKGNGFGEFDLPHALAVDATGRVYVVDRNNKRIQIFDAGGNYITHWPEGAFSSAQDLKIASDGRVFIASAGREGPVDRTGVVVLDSIGRFVERIGSFGNYDGQFYDLHWVALSRLSAFYTADFQGRRVQKFVH